MSDTRYAFLDWTILDRVEGGGAENVELNLPLRAPWAVTTPSSRRRLQHDGKSSEKKRFLLFTRQNVVGAQTGSEHSSEGV